MTRIGVAFFPTDYAIQPAPLARALEEREFDCLYLAEHTHIPASRKSPWPGGGELPREYWHTHDPFVALTAAATATERLRLGTGVCLVVERDPIQLAKEVASLDVISGGRFTLGVGAGWNREEMENHGAVFTRRWDIVREKVLAMKAIWTQEEPEFHGEFVNFDPIWSWPKPLQPGGPRVLLGAQSRWTFDRVVDYADGWMPIDVRGNLEDGMGALREAAERTGRDFSALGKTLYAAAAPERDTCMRMMELGFDELAIALPAEPEAQVLARLDDYAELAAGLRQS